MYYISAWASALLVSTDRAMPEPQSVGRATVQIPALFLFKHVKHETALLGESKSLVILLL